jgi:hypothetical protein
MPRTQAGAACSSSDMIFDQPASHDAKRIKLCPGEPGCPPDHRGGGGRGGEVGACQPALRSLQIDHNTPDLQEQTPWISRLQAPIAGRRRGRDQGRFLPLASSSVDVIPVATAAVVMIRARLQRLPSRCPASHAHHCRTAELLQSRPRSSVRRQLGRQAPLATTCWFSCTSPRSTGARS